MNRYLWLVGALLLFAAMGCSTHWAKWEEGRTTLYLKAKKAETVMFHCSLNDFQPVAADEVRSGLYAITLSEDTCCRYFFRINGQVYVPKCELMEGDDFGGFNCIICPRGGAEEVGYE